MGARFGKDRVGNKHRPSLFHDSFLVSSDRAWLRGLMAAVVLSGNRSPGKITFAIHWIWNLCVGFEGMPAWGGLVLWGNPWSKFRSINL
jgi:hypothetical protein